MMPKEIILRPDSEGGWIVESTLANREAVHFDSFEEAERIGRDASRRLNVDFVIQQRDGSVTRES